MRTRLWESQEGSSTCVQVRDDTTQTVWMHTNIGWVSLANSPETYDAACKFADGYRLVESSQRRALRMADAPEEDEE